MAIKHYSSEDFQNIPLQNVIIHSAAAAPSSPAVGQIYYDTALVRYRWWTGSAWVTLTLDGHQHTFADVGGILPMSKGGTGINLNGAATGAVFTKGSAAEIVTVPQGAAGTVLMSQGGNNQPSWQSISMPTTLPPSGAAGGSLSGSYPDPGIADGKVFLNNLNGAVLPQDVAGGLAAASNAALRTLGRGPHSALRGDITLAEFMNTGSSGNSGGDINMGYNTFVALKEPANPSDAATKNYVDNLAQGLSPKTSVRVATNTNLNIESAPAAAGGVNLSNNDRVLVMSQANPSQNGIYTFNGTGQPFSRTSDANSSSKLRSAFVFVEEGTYADMGYVQTSDNINLGTTAINWTKFTAAASFTVQAPLYYSSNLINLSFAQGLSAPLGVLIISDQGVTEAKIADGAVNLATKVTGTLPISRGGTGQTTALAARMNLNVPGHSSATISQALTAGVWSSNITPINTNLQGYSNIEFFVALSGVKAEIEYRINGDATFAVRSDVSVPANTLAYACEG